MSAWLCWTEKIAITKTFRFSPVFQCYYIEMRNWMRHIEYEIIHIGFRRKFDAIGIGKKKNNGSRDSHQFSQKGKRGRRGMFRYVLIRCCDAPMPSIDARFDVFKSFLCSFLCHSEFLHFFVRILLKSAPSGKNCVSPQSCIRNQTEQT